MEKYCGYIALIGRPNVGKSTLLNRILQQKISITSRKPQTTRHRILGVCTEGNYQFVYVDTPGIHHHKKHALNQLMNKTALHVLHDVDAIVFIIESCHWKEEDEYILQQIKSINTPCVLVINKVDKIADKSTLLPLLAALSQQHTFNKIIPLSAKTGDQVDRLHHQLQPLLPKGPHVFAEDQFTDRPVRFLCAELVREKIFRLCGQELPYSTTVELESFQEEDQLIRIHALIWVDKDNHKRMIIGNKGSKLKDIATTARLDMEQLLDKKVYLRCWCKVKSGWSNDERLLKQMGYDR